MSDDLYRSKTQMQLLDPVDENSVGGSTGCTTLFLSCMAALQEEIKRSPRGKKVREILHYLEKHCDRTIFTEIAVLSSTKLQSCIEGNKYKLLSISQGCMWNAFHKLRDSDVMKWVWSTFVAAIEVPQQCRTESQPRNLWWTGFLKRYWEKGQCYETPLHSQKSIGTTDHAREEYS